jgi:hypothetical protein
LGERGAQHSLFGGDFVGCCPVGGQPSQREEKNGSEQNELGCSIFSRHKFDVQTTINAACSSASEKLIQPRMVADKHR